LLPLDEELLMSGTTRDMPTLDDFPDDFFMPNLFSHVRQNQLAF
jgi:hypothetical protein